MSTNISTKNYEYTDINIQYAKGFSIRKANNHTKIILFDLENIGDTIAVIYLYKNEKIDSTNPKTHSFKLPIGSLALESTTHSAYMLKLGLEEQISAMTWTSSVQDPKLRRLIEKFEIIDMTAANTVDLEKLAFSNSQAITISPFSIASKDKFASIDMSSIVVSEYLETSPLASAEWIKFFGALFDMDVEAQTIFNKIETKYLDLKTSYKNSHTPLVFIGSEYNGQWSVPGSESNIVQLIEDAGAEYFTDNHSRSNIQLDIEKVVQEAATSDYFGKILSEDLNPSNISSIPNRLENIKAIKDNNVFYCNTSSSDYFVSAIVEPDVLLQDLINVFHPDNDSLNKYEPKYFRVLDLDR